MVKNLASQRSHGVKNESDYTHVLGRAYVGFGSGMKQLLPLASHWLHFDAPSGRTHFTLLSRQMAHLHKSDGEGRKGWKEEGRGVYAIEGQARSTLGEGAEADGVISRSISC